MENNKLFNNPFIDRPHPNGTGVQKIYKFKNGYGASVVNFSITGVPDIMGVKFSGSYANKDDEFELAVLKFDDNGDDYELDYSTEITDNVIGYLKEEDVEKILNKIKKLKK